MEAGGNYARKGASSLLRLLLRFGQFQEVQHLFPDQGASALVAEVHVIFIDDHHTHFHPFRQHGAQILAFTWVSSLPKNSAR